MNSVFVKITFLFTCYFLIYCAGENHIEKSNPANIKKSDHHNNFSTHHTSKNHNSTSKKDNLDKSYIKIPKLINQKTKTKEIETKEKEKEIESDEGYEIGDETMTFMEDIIRQLGTDADPNSPPEETSSIDYTKHLSQLKSQFKKINESHTKMGNSDEELNAKRTKAEEDLSAFEQIIITSNKRKANKANTARAAANKWDVNTKFEAAETSIKNYFNAIYTTYNNDENDKDNNESDKLKTKLNEYETKLNEYETKLNEYETKLNEYETKLNQLNQLNKIFLINNTDALEQEIDDLEQGIRKTIYTTSQNIHLNRTTRAKNVDLTNIEILLRLLEKYLSLYKKYLFKELNLYKKDADEQYNEINSDSNEELKNSKNGAETDLENLQEKLNNNLDLNEAELKETKVKIDAYLLLIIKTKEEEKKNKQKKDEDENTIKTILSTKSLLNNFIKLIINILSLSNDNSTSSQTTKNSIENLKSNFLKNIANEAENDLKTISDPELRKNQIVFVLKTINEKLTEINSTLFPSTSITDDELFNDQQKNPQNTYYFGHKKNLSNQVNEITDNILENILDQINKDYQTLYENILIIKNNHQELINQLNTQKDNLRANAPPLLKALKELEKITNTYFASDNNEFQNELTKAINSLEYYSKFLPQNQEQEQEEIKLITNLESNLNNLNSNLEISISENPTIFSSH